MLNLPRNEGTEQSKRHLAAITRGLFLIGAQAEIRPAIEWLEGESFRLAMEACEEGDIHQIKKLHGGVKVIQALMEKIKKARDIAESLE